MRVIVYHAADRFGLLVVIEQQPRRARYIDRPCAALSFPLMQAPLRVGVPGGGEIDRSPKHRDDHPNLDYDAGLKPRHRVWRRLVIEGLEPLIPHRNLHTSPHHSELGRDNDYRLAIQEGIIAMR